MKSSVKSGNLHGNLEIFLGNPEEILCRRGVSNGRMRSTYAIIITRANNLSFAKCTSFTPCCSSLVVPFYALQKLEKMAPCRPSCRRRRVRKALLLLLLVLSSAPRPHLSHSSELRLRVPPKESCYDYERSYAREQLRYQLRSLLLTPTFMFYLVLMAFLALLFTLALLDIFLKDCVY